MRKLLQSVKKCAALVLVLALVLAVFGGSAEVMAATSIVDKITDAAGTTGNIVKGQKKAVVVDRYDLGKCAVKAVSAGWNDTSGAAVVVVKCKSASKAKNAKKKFDSYVKFAKENAALYGREANACFGAAKTGTVGKYAILVMVSGSPSNNKKGLDAAVKALEKK